MNTAGKKIKAVLDTNVLISGPDIAIIVQPKRKISVIKTIEADNRILECAIEANADYIVTGDHKHLQPLKEFQGITILSPAQFLAIL